jgi:FAD/FMN-containing dehydrogenase
MDGDGMLRTCSRAQNHELFRLAIGGYGLFGVVTRVQLRLMPRTKLERVVQVIDTNDLMKAFDQRIADGYLYGDCQFSTDASSDGFLKKGVFSCYRLLPAAMRQPADVFPRSVEVIAVYVIVHWVSPCLVRVLRYSGEHLGGVRP